MTYSILARDPESGDIGAAVATGTPVVGGFVLHLLAGIGAVATQGYSTSTLYGPHGLRLLEEGQEALAVCRLLTREDVGRDHRQLIVLNRNGRTAGWTGAGNVDAKLHLCEPDLAVAGNWIASEAVVSEMRRAFLEASGRPMIERLLSALGAAESAGGDSRGARSAAVKVVGTSRPPLDLRVDLHERPIERLADIHRVIEDAEFQAFLNRIPTTDEPMRF